MRKFFTLALAAVSFSTFAQEQDNIKYCGTYEAIEAYLEANPHLREAYLEEQKNSGMQQGPSQKSAAGTVYTIPVVIHIVHNYGLENVSDAQVHDAIRILNEDFRMQNSDTSNIIPAFKSIAADAEIEFRLAQRDPNGNCTNGIDRIASMATYAADEDTKFNPWPRNRYLNIWVVNTIASGAAGYTFTPSNWLNPAKDGIIIRYDYFGSIGTGSVGRSRALTHEIGHWLNLHHTWGGSNNPGLSSNCGDDDNVGDTPNTIGWTSCNLTGNTCSSLDNVQNYMEYSYCSNMYTQGQVTRMRNALTSSTGQRNQLWTASTLAATGTNGNDILCQADFEASNTYVCAGDQVSFTDKSYNGQSSWNWSFTGGTPSSSTQANPTVTYNTPGVYPVTLTVGDGVSTKTTTRSGYITVFDSPGHPNPVVEGFEAGWIDPAFWMTENPDGGTTWTLANVGSTGSHSVMLSNLSNPAGRKDALISKPFNMSNLSAVTMSFKVAYARRTNSDVEFLRVYVSSNCGKTWQLRYGKSGSSLATAPNTTSNFVPTLTQWSTETISNISASSLTNEFMFKFEFESDGGNHIYIDDINIGQNVGIETINGSTSFNVFPNPVTESTQVYINNAGSVSTHLFITDLTGRKVTDLHVGNMPGGDSAFELPASLSAGVYFIVLDVDGNRQTRKVVVQ